MPWSDYTAGKYVTSVLSTAGIVNRICHNSRDHTDFPFSYYSVAVFIKFVDTFNNLSLLIKSPRWQNLSTIPGFFISERINSWMYIIGGSLEWWWLQFKCSFFASHIRSWLKVSIADVKNRLFTWGCFRPYNSMETKACKDVGINLPWQPASKCPINWLWSMLPAIAIASPMVCLKARITFLLCAPVIHWNVTKLCCSCVL